VKTSSQSYPSLNSCLSFCNKVVLSTKGGWSIDQLIDVIECEETLDVFIELSMLYKLRKPRTEKFRDKKFYKDTFVLEL